MRTTGVLVVGGGPAGLAAARAARRAGAGSVLVVEREDAAGGVPRHCAHTGFGWRDLHRVLDGPAYARRIAEITRAAGVEIATRTMVTGWADDGAALITGPDGPDTIRASAVVLATGARERPRPARLVPGDRPAGVLTTGELQQRVSVHHLDVGHRAVVVGAEHVSYSAVLTLRHAGVETVGMVTEWGRHQSLAAFAAVTARVLRVPLWTGTTVSAVRGHRRVESVELTDRTSGAVRTVSVDTVVFSGDWIPDHELARACGLTMDPASRAPVVDQDGATSTPGVWAAGNLVHPAETADIAACRARRAGAAAAAWARVGPAAGTARPTAGTGPADATPGPTARAARAAVAVVAHPPLRWVTPAVITPGAAAGDAMILRTDAFLTRASIVIDQGDRRLARYRLGRAIPNRSHSVPSAWVAKVDAGDGPVHVHIEED